MEPRTLTGPRSLSSPVETSALLSWLVTKLVADVYSPPASVPTSPRLSPPLPRRSPRSLSAMSIPSLPAEIISQILDLLEAGDNPDEFMVPYADLRACCLVGRAFLEPARAALYRTLEVRVNDRFCDSSGRVLHPHAVGTFSPVHILSKET